MNNVPPAWLGIAQPTQNDPLMTSEQSITALERAAKNDERLGGGQGGNTGAFSSEFAVLSARRMPISQDRMLAGQKPVVALALKENNLPAVTKALGEAKAIHVKYSAIVGRVQESLHDQVTSEYQRLVDGASERVVNGDAGALDALETKTDIETRFNAERDALHAATSKLGHAQVKIALVLRDEIDDALAKLAKSLEDHDTELCARFGMATEWGVSTRLVQSVRIQFHRRAIGLDKLAQSHPTSACSPMVKIIFDDFLDLSGW